MSMPTSLSTLATTPAPRRVVALTILMVARVRTRPLAPRPGEGVNLTPVVRLLLRRRGGV